MKVFQLAELPSAAGTELGCSDWWELTQEHVNEFARTTGDNQWIHVDVERARASDFKGTVAHGFLTLSLIPALLSQVWRIEGRRMGINYGLNKVRFPTPVPIPARLRLHAKIAESVARDDGSVMVTLGVEFEREGGDRPPCVAEVLALNLP